MFISVRGVVYARWFIPVNVVLAAIFGCLVGYAVALLIKPPPEFFNFTVVFIGIGTQLSIFEFILSLAATTCLFNLENAISLVLVRHEIVLVLNLEFSLNI